MSGLPRKWQIAVCISIGAAAGIALVIVRAANASSYLSDSPDACMNCHVMTDAYVSWQRSSHGHCALCTDCHVPHANIIARYAFKACDGAKHSYVFTASTQPQVIKLSRRAVPVVKANCVRCHNARLEMVRLASASERRCWDCHESPHGRVQSLSASPVELRPPLPAAGLH